MLHLLQHRIGLAGGKGVTGKQQNRNLIRRCRRGSGQHIGRTRPNGSGAGHNPPPAALLGERSRCMHHSLLVPALVNRQPARRFLQRLPHSEYVTMAKYGEHAMDEAFRATAKVHILLIQEFYQRLRRR